MLSSQMPHARRMVRGIVLLFSLVGLGVILWSCGELVFLQKTRQVHDLQGWIEWFGKAAFVLLHASSLIFAAGYWLVMRKPWYFDSQRHVVLSYLWLACVALGVTLELVCFSNNVQLATLPAVLCFLSVVKVLHLQRDYGELLWASS